MSDDVHGGRNRPVWGGLPLAVRERIVQLVGSDVVSSSSAAGGFSPGFASSLDLADGRKVFVKAMSDELTPGGSDIYRRERDILLQLPSDLPTAHLRSTDDDGDWIVLVYDHVDGRNPNPSRPDELEAILATYTELAARLTPSPLQLAHVRDASGFDNWTRLRVEGREQSISSFRWAYANLDTLTGLEAGWREAVDGTTLVHGDLRADNMVLTPDGIVVVDWPWASVGPAWLDLVFALPSMGMYVNGPDPERVVSTHPLTRTVDAHRLSVVIAAMAGYFACGSVLPPPPGLPTLREFQRAQAVVCLDWMAGRLAG